MKRKTILIFALLLPGGAVLADADRDRAIAAVQAVGPEGKGNVLASEAWKVLAAGPADSIPAILEAMNGGGGLSNNWLRSAVDVIVQRSGASGQALPVAEIGAFLFNSGNHPDARKLAFDLIGKAEPETAELLVPGFLQDPSTDLRWLAVDRLAREASDLEQGGSQARATVLYQQALQAARHSEQVEQISKALDELGQEVDLPRHFGFLMHWHVIGPFDNTGRAGFDTVFGPENGIDLEAVHEGKSEEVRWQPFASVDPYGTVDINKPCGMLKEVTAYAYTVFNSAQARPAELRLSCKNAWKIWLNGEFVFGRDEYHRGQRIDQYVLPVNLEAGKNTILVKVCQNEQTEDWTVEWEFKLRVCDSTGTAILAVDRPPTPKSTRQKRS